MEAPETEMAQPSHITESANPGVTVRHSPSLAQLGEALSLAQQEIEGATKDSANPFFQSRYADLASVWEACRKPLAKNGLAVLQPVSANGSERVTVTTMLLHKSGEWVATDLTLAAVQSTPQAIGSAITYGRRYGLAAMVGVAPEDDDGEAAEGRGSGRSASKSATCPECGKAGTIIKGSAEYGGGWLCWKKKGGCGAKFSTNPSESHEPPAGDGLEDGLEQSIEEIGRQLFTEVCKFCNKADVADFLRSYLGTADLNSIDAYSKVSKLKEAVAQEKKQPGGGTKWVAETAQAYRKAQQSQPTTEPGPTLVKPDGDNGQTLIGRFMALAKRVGMKDGLKLMNAYLDGQFGHHDVMKPRNPEEQERLAAVFAELERMQPQALRTFLQR